MKSKEVTRIVAVSWDDSLLTPNFPFFRLEM